jgi:sec-independent protein translocase protein TatA
MQTGGVTDLGWPELLIVAAIAMLLFGTKKMPDMARSIGRSMRIVKAELSGLHDDEPAPAATPPAAAAPAARPQPEPVVEPSRPIEPPTR